MDGTPWTSPKPGEPPLHTAARLGDHVAMRRLVAAGADLNAAFDMRLDPWGYPINATPLMVAAGSGDGATLETVRLLLDLGADPAVLLDGRSATDFAARGLGNLYRPGGDADRLRFLLETGSPIAPQGPFGARLVADTAELGDPERLRILLALGATPNAQWDPKAAAERHHRVMTFARSKISEMLARENLPDEIVSRVQQRQGEYDASPTAPDDFEIPLFQAVSSGNAECVRLLLQAGANPQQQDSAGRTALYYAHDEEIARTLLAAGLRLEHHDQSGWTPIEDAVRDENGQRASWRVRTLIAVGADVNAAANDGYTLFLHSVHSAGREHGVPQMLLDAGADPHALTHDGQNAFHAIAHAVWADLDTKESIRRIASFLQAQGVDMNHRDARGLTPLARAIAEMEDNVAEVLRQMGAAFDT